MHSCWQRAIFAIIKTKYDPQFWQLFPKLKKSCIKAAGEAGRFRRKCVFLFYFTFSYLHCRACPRIVSRQRNIPWRLYIEKCFFLCQICTTKIEYTSSFLPWFLGLHLDLSIHQDSYEEVNILGKVRLFETGTRTEMWKFGGQLNICGRQNFCLLPYSLRILNYSEREHPHTPVPPTSRHVPGSHSPEHIGELSMLPPKATPI